MVGESGSHVLYLALVMARVSRHGQRRTRRLRFPAQRAGAAGSLDRHHSAAADLSPFIHERLHAFPSATHTVLQLSAVLGRQIAPDEIAAILDDPEEMYRSMPTAVRGGFLDVTEEGRYRFRHDILRTAVLGGMEAGERRRLSERAARALDDSGVTMAGDRNRRLAELYLQGLSGEAQARGIHYARQAAEAALETNMTGGSALFRLGRRYEAFAPFLKAFDHFEATRQFPGDLPRHIQGLSYAPVGQLALRDGHVERALAMRLGMRPLERRLTPTAVLTDRQRDVLALVAEGMSNKQIADRLGISTNTVAIHVSRLMRKMEAQSRTEMVHRATKLGLVDA